MYSIWTINTTYGMQYAGYHFLYTFMFSMIVGELIRATKGRDLYCNAIPCCNDICSSILI